MTLYLQSFEKRGTLMPCWQECEIVQPLIKGNLTVSFKIAITFTLGHRNSTWEIYLIDIPINVENDLCTSFFIGLLFIIAKYWKQAKGPSLWELLSKLQYIHVVEYASSLKNENDLYTEKKKEKHHIICLYQKRKVWCRRMDIMWYVLCKMRGNKPIYFHFLMSMWINTEQIHFKG